MTSTHARSIGLSRLPVTGAWIEGGEAGHRRFFDLHQPLVLQRGGTLPGVRIAYETWGRHDADGGNAVLVEHALTGDSHVTGAAGNGHPTEGWWRDLVGPGKAIDTNDHFVVAANVLGGCQGTTGPSSLAPDGKAWGSRFPEITVADQVEAEVALADALGIRRWCTVVGGSMGGMRALQWAQIHPDRVGALAVLASSAYATAAQIANQTAQIEAIRNDPFFNAGNYYDQPGGPAIGMGIARRFAFLTYRNEYELEERFGRQRQPESELLAVQSYFAHQANKLANRFDANTYIVLNEAMNHWSLGEGRTNDDWKDALQSIDVPAVVIGVDSDELYPLRLQQELALYLGRCVGGLRQIKSAFGHDGFLLETEQLTPHLEEALLLGRVAN